MLNNLPIFNVEREGNEEGGTQVTFMNPKYGWIPGLRWRELHLKKDSLGDTPETVFCVPTTREDWRVPPKTKFNFSGFLLLYFCGKISCEENNKGK